MPPARVSALEATYVWLERAERPIHVGAVAVFEAGPLLDKRGNLRLRALRRHVAARIRDLPRLQQRLAPSRFGLDRPRWVDDPTFAIERHVDAVHAAPPGDDAALRQIAGELHTRPFHPDHPPWDLLFVTGLEGGRVALVERVHHSLVDGVGGVDVAAVGLDLDPEGHVPALTAADVAPSAAPAPGGALAAVAAAAQPLAQAVRHPSGLARVAGTVARGIGALAGNGLAAPHTPLNVPAGRRRRLAWVRADLPATRATAHGAGATVNEVVLTAVAGGLRRLLGGRDGPVPDDLVLKALVPVSLRGPGSGDPLGNRVSAFVAPLPVGMADPVQRLDAVAAASRQLKHSNEADAVTTLVGASNALPAPIARVVAWGLERQPFVNLVVTNVPGPPVPVYLRGARMLEAFGVVPLAANLSVGVAILSYGDALNLCVTADADVWPDIDAFAAGIEDDLGELGVPPRTAGRPT